MEYKLIKGNQSNYEIELTYSQDEVKKFEEKILKDFQKEVQMPWFRKWHVPLEYVKKLINPEYIKAGIYEYAIQKGLEKIMKENTNIKFIWNIYDLNVEEKDNSLKIKFKLDVYPTVEILNENWKAVKIDKIDDNVTDEEIKQVLDSIANQYAEFRDKDEITENSIVKAKLYYKNKKGEVIEEWTVFLWPEDFKEFKILRDNLIWKKKDEEITLNYSKKDFPPHLQHKDSKKRPAVLVIKPVDIKEKILPEINDEFVKKYFGDEIENLNQLEEKIKKEIQKVKYQQWLVNAIEKYLWKVWESFDLQIPKTLIDEEIKARLSSLKRRFWWEDGFKKYLEALWEEKSKKLMEDIQNAASESLKKFFILKKVIELFDIQDIDWNKPLDVEEKLYKKLVGNK